MKKIVAFLVAFNLCFLSICSSMFLLAETYPLHPGDGAYIFQHTAEQARLRLTSHTVRKAQIAMKLVERRLADLALAGAPKKIEASAAAFYKALNAAIQSIQAAPKMEQKALYDQLQILITQADLVVTALDSTAGWISVPDLHEKIYALMDTTNQDRYEQALPEKNKVITEITAEIISFLGKEVEHEKFPLADGHADLKCKSCHQDGKYVDTPSQCSACHRLAPIELGLAYLDPEAPSQTIVYPNHFAGECSDCHDAQSWTPTQFDHVGVVECISCHSGDVPTLIVERSDPLNSFFAAVAFRPLTDITFVAAPEHYPGDCILCHTDPISWQQAAYDHSQTAKCETCHTSETPESHYPGRCATCHSDVEDWGIASVNHESLTDCRSCHQLESPAGHYSSQCSGCHFNNDWGAVKFDHTAAAECQGCHNKPIDHSEGECVSCHDLQDWSVTTYHHLGQNDCKSCHTGPRDHFSGQCTNCHNTHNWNPTDFDHQEVSDCANCHNQEAPVDHYLMECANCHVVGEWTGASFNHTGSGECIDCHTAPAEHYLGTCSSCHNTNSWVSLSFDHTGYTDCLACHTPPVGHFTSQCSNCHTTDRWANTYIDHTGLVECLACHVTPDDHYLGQCTNCHTTASWMEISFDHTGYLDCTSCHAAPSGHWPGECLSCHHTTTWEDVDFDHTSYTNCKACHTHPDGHPSGQCSKCHTTDSWIIPSPTPAVANKVLSQAPAITTPIPEPTPIPWVLPSPSVETSLTPTLLPSATPTVEPANSPMITTINEGTR